VTEPVRLTIDGPRADVVLCRPDVHNALNGELLDALAAAIRDVAGRPEVRYAVLAGEGPSFCAGADVHWMRASLHATLEENRTDAARLVGALTGITTCPKPVLARVHGAVLGGGVGLVAACDLVAAAPTATFGLTEVRLGLVPAMIFPFLLRRIALPELRRAALTGDRFPAQVAAEIGLVDQVADDPEMVIGGWAESLLAAGPQALAGVKEVFNVFPFLPPDALRAQAISVGARVRAGPEAQEGMRAFLERRRPPWKP
jgi:methylglutaconyl-CoA hydratase